MGAYQSITKMILMRVAFVFVFILVRGIAFHLTWLFLQHPVSEGLRLSVLASMSFPLTKVVLICCYGFPAL